MRQSTSRIDSATDILLFTDTADSAVSARLDILEAALQEVVDSRADESHHLSVSFGHEAPTSISNYDVDQL